MIENIVDAIIARFEAGDNQGWEVAPPFRVNWSAYENNCGRVVVMMTPRNNAILFTGTNLTAAVAQFDTVWGVLNFAIQGEYTWMIETLRTPSGENMFDLLPYYERCLSPEQLAY